MKEKIQGALFLVNGEVDVVFDAGYYLHMFMHDHEVGAATAERNPSVAYYDNPPIKNLSCSKDRVSFGIRRAPEYHRVPARDANGDQIKDEEGCGKYVMEEKFTAYHEVNREWYHHVFNNRVIV